MMILADLGLSDNGIDERELWLYQAEIINVKVNNKENRWQLNIWPPPELIGRHGLGESEQAAALQIIAEKIAVKNKLDSVSLQFTSPDRDFIQKNDQLAMEMYENQSVKDRKDKRPAVIYGDQIPDSVKITPMCEINDEEKRVCIAGKIFQSEMTVLKSGRSILSFSVTDFTDSLEVKLFLEEDDPILGYNLLEKNNWVKIRGAVKIDKYSQELTMQPRDINDYIPDIRQDDFPEKRIELHAHTNMSTMDAIPSATDLIKQAAAWGHKAIAITDHGNVQSFPEAFSAGKKNNIKIIYGIEAYLLDDMASLVSGEQCAGNNQNELLSDLDYVVFDIETTGLSPLHDKIIEIGAVKYSGGQAIETFSTFVNPERPISAEITELTGISNEMVADAPLPDAVLRDFQSFIEDCILVAHNANFDCGFIRHNFKKLLNIPLKNKSLDTLQLARVLLPDLKNHKLGTLTDALEIKLEHHHRALDDAQATCDIFAVFLRMLHELNIDTLSQVSSMKYSVNLDRLKTSHAVILVKNLVGLENLYRLVSASHLKYFYRHARIPKSLLSEMREGLLIGSACESGQLYRAILENQSDEKIEEIASFYDYLEIMPLANNYFLISNGTVQDIEELRNINRRIVELGKKINKPVVATGDLHYLEKQDDIYRRILLNGMGYESNDQHNELYFRTTSEMMNEFSYLGEETAREVVIDNPNLINEQIEMIRPFPEGLHTPEIPGAEDTIKNMTYETAYALYGNPLPEIVQKRVEKELNSIISNGYAVLYLIAHKLVKKSNEDGYMVGSRGSVGSSFVATMCKITEVNPLPPHYLCSRCQYSEFITDGSYGAGVDMPDKYCPRCGHILRKEGFDIPFEVFLGFDGDKVPDIDLNFSGEYQPHAHKYTEELFGKDHVFRAGTISTVKEKTAYGFVKKYFEGQLTMPRQAELNRLAAGCTGVKRTTSQHPGGLIIVPTSLSIYQFTPIQHPADDKEGGTITTHFDFHAIHDNLVKLDNLGHDDPTMIKVLEDLTGLDAHLIPLDEPQVMSLFSGTEALKVDPRQINSRTGTLGIPEFGTKFVRQMLEDTKPDNFSGLVRISGFSHGTDVWLNNAQDLIKNGTCQLYEAISARDDIMLYLLHKGLDARHAFKIMELVRKGRFAGKMKDYEQEMREHNVPEWYIKSCCTIKYMFPKGHAVAYVMMAYRIAYYKLYYPYAFYAAYFTVRADDFDAAIMCKSPEEVRKLAADIEKKGNDITNKEKNVLTILELIVEMNARGIALRKVDLRESAASRFLITDEGILPPISALSGVGETAAENLVKARDEAWFTSIEDMKQRGKASKTTLDALEQQGCLKGMSATNQMELFDMSFDQ